MHKWQIRPLEKKSEQDTSLWIAHFGGSFNPVHIEHIAIGRCLLDEYHFDRVVYVPNSRHYSKPGLASEAARLALLQIVVADEPRFEVSEYELNKNRWTEPIETIKYLKHKYEQEAENVRMFTVRGDDWLPELVKWTDEIVHHVGVYDFIFVPRGESGVQDISATSEQVDLIRNMSYLMKFRQLRKVSSTLIRERLKRGEIHDLPIPEGVLELIQSKRLYMSDGSDNEMDAL